MISMTDMTIGSCEKNSGKSAWQSIIGKSHYVMTNQAKNSTYTAASGKIA
jgi:hypothetical protein